MKLWACLGTGIALVLAVPADAQETGAGTTPPRATDPASASAPDAGDIVVTAQRRSERLQDVPIAITALDSRAFVNSGAKTLSDIQGIAPGIYISQSTGYASAPISIRGTAGSNTFFVDDPVAVYVNGIYQSSGAFSGTSLVDVGSLEIVRGPQGTLQGRNATAGAVLITTPDPGHVVAGYGRLTFADPTEVRAEGAINLPFTSRIATRLAVGYYDDRGWATNTFNGKRIGGGRGFTARATTKWEPSDALEIRFIAGHTYTLVQPALTRYAATPANPNPAGALIPAGTATPGVPLSAAQLHAILDDNLFALNRPTFTRITDDNAVLNATLHLGGVDLISLTGYDSISSVGQSDSDGFANTAREGFNAGSLPAKVFSQEVRLQSADSGSRLSWIVGGYYSSAIQRMNFNIYNFQLTVPTRLDTRYVAYQDGRSFAGFADATFRILPTVSVIGGVRYTRETKDFTLNAPTTNVVTGALSGTPIVYNPDQAVFDNVSWRAKLIYQPSRDLLVYGGYSTGFKSGGFNAFGNDPAFKPEKLNSAEIGAKLDLIDHRLSLALAAYTNLYSDLQVRVGVPTGGVAITNAASSRIKGLEAEATLHPVNDLTLTGNVSYTHGRYSSFPGARNLLNQGPIDASGNSLVRSPDWQFYLQSSYAPQVTANKKALVEVSYRYRSRIYLYQTDQLSSTIQGVPLGELGARIGVTDQPSQVSLTLYGTNLTNARSVAGGSITFSYPQVSFNRPRTIGLQLEKKF
ncbi:TonB-dependent receptor [Sphingomonas sp. CLY1604]|uniref:TonB-dependent receptor n=1 Tax=Sphingomonas sp. CLY1604 TaxID=3457786 RepID=UPI003FD87841